MEIQHNNEYSFSDCFTYSPNWYVESAIAFDPFTSHLYYCSNSLLYKYDIHLHKVLSQIQCRQILKEKHLPLETIQNTKAFCVHITQSTIYIGLNDGIILMLNKDTLQAKSILNTKLKNISIILQVTKQQLVIIDQIGVCVKSTIGGDLNIKISNKKNRCKKLAMFQQKNWVVFYQNGEIHLFDSTFDKQIRRLHFFKNESILSVDTLQNKILILSRNQQQFVITYCEFAYGHQFPVEHTKTINEISNNLFRCTIVIEYPKKYQYKKQQMKKASLTVKWISNTMFVLSGKLGQLYTFQTQKCIGKNKLQLRPFSNIEQETVYEKVPQSYHFQDIYAMYVFKDNFLTIGTDRILTLWKTNQSSIQYQYQIRFLGSKVKTIFRSESEKNYCFLLMENSIVRSWDVEEHIKGEGLMNQYWKIGKKLSIEKISSCPKYEGVVAILSTNNQLFLYDLHEQRTILQIQVGDDTKQIGFLDSQTLQNLCKFMEHELSQIQIPQKQLFKRTFSQDCFLALYDKNYISVLNLESRVCKRLGRFFNDMTNVQFIQDIFFHSNVIVSTVKSPSTFNLYIFSNNVPHKYSFEQKFLSHKYYIRIINQQKIIVCLWKNKDINLILFDIQKEPKQIATGHCQFNYYVNYCEFSPDGNKLLCYSNLNSTLQIWDVKQKDDSLILISRNIKAHQGYVIAAGFWNNKYAISCSQDHNIKVWDCDNIPERHPPKGSKTNKKKKKKLGTQKQTNKTKEKEQKEESSEQEKQQI